MRDEDGEIIDVICEIFIITGLTEDDFRSLTDEQAEKYLSEFILSEIIFRTVKGLVVQKWKDNGHLKAVLIPIRS